MKQKQKYVRKLTLWFGGHTNPMRPGVYQVSPQYVEKHRRGASIMYSYWNGAAWSLICRTPEEAEKNKRVSANRLAYPWRGRTQP